VLVSDYLASYQIDLCIGRSPAKSNNGPAPLQQPSKNAYGFNQKQLPKRQGFSLRNDPAAHDRRKCRRLLRIRSPSLLFAFALKHADDVALGSVQHHADGLRLSTATSAFAALNYLLAN